MHRLYGVTVHYTASPPTGTVEAIAAYQTGDSAQEPFPEIAYTLMVPADGSIAWCHDLNVRCWHSGAWGRNDFYVGVCFINNSRPSDVQLQGLAYAIHWVQTQLGRELIVEGHKDAYPTACPGAEWPSWREELMEAVRRLQ